MIGCCCCVSFFTFLFLFRLSLVEHTHSTLERQPDGRDYKNPKSFLCWRRILYRFFIYIYNYGTPLPSLYIYIYIREPERESYRTLLAGCLLIGRIESREAKKERTKRYTQTHITHTHTLAQTRCWHRLDTLCVDIYILRE